MAATTGTKLRIRAMVPVFELMSADGHPVNIWSFKGLKNMVFVLLDDETCEPCISFLRNAMNMQERYKEESTVLLPIIRGKQDQAARLKDTLKPPFPILYDPTGEVIGLYTNELPAVFVADRFGELYAQWMVGHNGSFPSQKNILDVVELINLECPECGAKLDWT